MLYNLFSNNFSCHHFNSKLALEKWEQSQKEDFLNFFIPSQEYTLSVLKLCCILPKTNV